LRRKKAAGWLQLAAGMNPLSQGSGTIGQEKSLSREAKPSPLISKQPPTINSPWAKIQTSVDQQKRGLGREASGYGCRVRDKRIGSKEEGPGDRWVGGNINSELEKTSVSQ